MCKLECSADDPDAVAQLAATRSVPQPTKLGLSTLRLFSLTSEALFSTFEAQKDCKT